ncbi:PucR family transcriptional regulator [Spongiactinospora gelatinilytica]|uniref:PucR family transcriptional regulator n=1 Tax=Spongiactinospora gelatinilytica TaxID=2666298 RepID=A0A2W2GMH1_9ACTN|nr:helix-turn-helix domain-containing protein [Spongiactinospora gelatinilytica]PZG50706.1 PucR family transcriptional regulator [Spongiactinospora gelatinilytica]
MDRLGVGGKLDGLTAGSERELGRPASRARGPVDPGDHRARPTEAGAQAGPAGTGPTDDGPANTMPAGVGQVDIETFATELNELALGGEGWKAVLARVAERTGRAARLMGVHGGVFAATDGGDAMMSPAEVAKVFAEREPVTVTLEDGWPARALAVWAGQRRVGLLLLAEPVDDGLLALLKASSTAVAIEAVRRDAAATATAETASRLIDELRFGALRGTDELTRTAARFGLRLSEPHAAVVFDYGGPNRRTWSTALSWLEMPVRQEDTRGWTVLGGGDLAREITRIRVRLQGMVGDGTVLAATGPVVNDPRETARSFRDAEVVLGLLRRRTGETELLHSALGLAQLLLAVPPDRLRAFVNQQLGPILDRPELILTLDAWLATRGSRANVAEQLHLHRNSVGYRVGQLRQLLGTDPLDPEAAHRLRTALTARELLDVFSQRTP